jgi:hypothetical protein
MKGILSVKQEIVVADVAVLDADFGQALSK